MSALGKADIDGVLSAATGRIRLGGGEEPAAFGDEPGDRVVGTITWRVNATFG